MKALVTIESVEITRKVQRQDGTWGNVYGVIMVSGDDKILAECWRSEESMKRTGIAPGAVGTAHLEFKVSRGVSKAGNPYLIGNISLRGFDLANQNIRTDTAATTEAPSAQPEASAAQVAAGMAEAAAEAEMANIDPETGLPF